MHLDRHKKNCCENKSLKTPTEEGEEEDGIPFKALNLEHELVEVHSAFAGSAGQFASLEEQVHHHAAREQVMALKHFFQRFSAHSQFSTRGGNFLLNPHKIIYLGLEIHKRRI